MTPNILCGTPFQKGGCLYPCDFIGHLRVRAKQVYTAS
jgi:hypothetical protein